MNKRCIVKLNKGWRSEIQGILLGFVPSERPYGYRPLAGTELSINYTQDALVQLCNFSRGHIYQLPLDLITMIDGSFDNESAEEYYESQTND